LTLRSKSIALSKAARPLKAKPIRRIREATRGCILEGTSVR
jgi:hypothetical protein